jgi:Leucine-rich repeat (LRR) protein
MKMTADLLLKEVETLTGAKLQEVSVDEIVSCPNAFSINRNQDVIALHLDSLKLADISFLKNLTGLKQLILRGSHIKDIGNLANLGNLTYLDLKKNQISDVSPGLHNLKQLTHLILRWNKITDISFLKPLGTLEELDLSENDISDVSCIKDLTHLRKLDLDFNKITILPEDIAFLKKLERLSILGNPLEIPPHSRANDGLESIRNYFRNHHGSDLPCAFDKKGEDMKNDRKMGPKVKRKKIFISYSHHDTDWLIRVQKHLRVLANNVADIDVWADNQIRAGMNWKKEIEKALNEAKIAVLLITTDFLSSDFIRENELPPLLGAAKKDGATILPLIVKPSRFKKIENLSQFQAVNLPEKSLIDMQEGEQEETLVKLTDIIEEILSNENPGAE